MSKYFLYIIKKQELYVWNPYPIFGFLQQITFLIFDIVYSKHMLYSVFDIFNSPILIPIW